MAAIQKLIAAMPHKKKKAFRRNSQRAADEYVPVSSALTC